jgi:hypothetical protein
MEDIYVVKKVRAHDKNPQTHTQVPWSFMSVSYTILLSLGSSQGGNKNRQLRPNGMQSFRWNFLGRNIPKNGSKKYKNTMAVICYSSTGKFTDVKTIEVPRAELQKYIQDGAYTGECNESLDVSSPFVYTATPQNGN